jgi:hypothetical protein
MTKLEELKAAAEAASDAADAACDDAWGAAWGAYQAELTKIQEENSND